MDIDAAVPERRRCLAHGSGPERIIDRSAVQRDAWHNDAVYRGAPAYHAECPRRSDPFDNLRNPTHDRGMRARAKRSEELLRIVRSEGEASIATLAQLLGISRSTIRRDLAALAKSGRILRTYGGAAIAGPARVRAAGPFDIETKSLIGTAAAGLVNDGDTIVITGGTTTLELARRLIDRQGLTVITNGLDVAQVLIDRPGINLIVLGGIARPGIHSLLGHLTETAARELRADRLFMGIPAIDAMRGLMSDYMPEVLTDRAILSIVREVVILADSSKLRRVEPAFVCGLGDVAVLITDGGISTSDQTALEARGIRVMIAARSIGSHSTVTPEAAEMPEPEPRARRTTKASSPRN